MKKTTNVKHMITKRSPKEAYKHLRTKPLVKIFKNHNTTYKLYDISDYNTDRPYAEVILLYDSPVQVRLLANKPVYHWNCTNVKFGKF